MPGQSGMGLPSRVHGLPLPGTERCSRREMAEVSSGLRTARL
jgi:hypothetical protein